MFYALAIFSSLLIVSDLELYRHWGFRLDTTPLLYTGSGGVGSVPLWIIILLIGIFVGLMIALHWGFEKFIKPQIHFLPSPKGYSLLMFFCTALLFIPIRSSFRVAPLNTGVVYFHKSKPFANHAGINVVWNFLKSAVSDNSFRYPSNFYDAQLTEQFFSDSQKASDSTFRTLQNDRPNIILIILESFTAKVVEPLGGLAGIAPNLSQLCSEGILFKSIYASGDRTDKGLISILSGYPAQPKTSIIKYPNKSEGLPKLPAVLASNGYYTSFVYGGDIGFANMESYLSMAGFAHITEDDDFDLMLNTGKWGVHDEFVFERMLQELDSDTQDIDKPFFKTMLSLSSHEPFEVPNRKAKESDEESLFLNSCSYADSCLGKFIREAKNKSWWKNTLVIITADHGHSFPGNSQNHEKDKFKIPMLWLGGAVSNPQIISTIGSQTDIAKTLLNQLNLNSADFSFGKNLLSENVDGSAVYIFNNGFGYVDSAVEYVYDFDMVNFLSRPDGATDENLAKGKAYMQKLFNDYNKR